MRPKQGASAFKDLRYDKSRLDKLGYAPQFTRCSSDDLLLRAIS